MLPSVLAGSGSACPAFAAGWLYGDLAPACVLQLHALTHLLHVHGPVQHLCSCAGIRLSMTPGCDQSSAVQDNHCSWGLRASGGSLWPGGRGPSDWDILLNMHIRWPDMGNGMCMQHLRLMRSGLQVVCDVCVQVRTGCGVLCTTRLR